MALCLSLVTPINSLRILASIAIGSGLYFCFSGFQILPRIRFLLSTPTSNTRNAALGLVEVCGSAVGPHTMSAPITGHACFLYRTTAWRQTPDQKRKWEKVADETLHAPFFIEDSTGHLLIEPFGADLDLHCDFQQEFDQPSASSASARQIPLCVSAFLARHGIASDCRLRIEEQLIKPKDALFIAGTLRENPGIEVYASAPRSKLRITVHDDNPSHDRKDIRSDARNPSLPISTANNVSESVPAPQIIRLAEAAGAAGASASHQMGQQAKIAAALTRAGIVKTEVWTSTGVSYIGASDIGVSDNGTTGRESLRPIATSSRHDSHLHDVRVHDERLREEQFQSTRLNSAPPVVLTQGANNPTFVISFRSPKAGLRGSAWKCAGMICGGSAMALLGFYMLLA